MAEAVVQGLTAAHWRRIGVHLERLQQHPCWDGSQPVLLLDRCWLRLSCVPVRHLAGRLPPDSSQDAPELVRYRQLRAAGHAAWQAELLCWDDFGSAACHQALRRYWQADADGGGWTLDRYLQLIGDYRRRFQQQRPRSLPLLVLSRQQQQPARGVDQLHWLCPGADGSGGSMRHTCP